MQKVKFRHIGELGESEFKYNIQNGRYIEIDEHENNNSYLKLEHDNVKISTSASLTEELNKAWATITFNSSPGVASAIEGVPVFVTDPEPKISQAFEVANTDLSQIENPKTFDREHWLQKIAMCHWNFEEIGNGTAWKHIKNYL